MHRRDGEFSPAPRGGFGQMERRAGNLGVQIPEVEIPCEACGLNHTSISGEGELSCRAMAYHRCAPVVTLEGNQVLRSRQGLMKLRLKAGDGVWVCMDPGQVSFMWSYPNLHASERSDDPTHP